MPNPNKLLRGRKTRINFDLLNKALDAGNDYRSRAFGSGGIGDQSTLELSGIVLVKNITGIDLPAFSVIRFMSVILTTPQSGEDHRSYAFSAAVVAAGYENQFAVTQEPIASNDFGHAMVVGVTPCRISRPNGDTSSTAGIDVTGNTYLLTGQTGAQILWEDPAFVGTAVHNALISIPSGGAGSSPANAVVVDRVPTATDGAAGSITTNGTRSIDGSNAGNNSLVLLRLQATVADRGIWKVNTGGAWTKSTPFQPTFAVVANGATLQDTLWYLSVVNTWRAVVGVYG